MDLIWNISYCTDKIAGHLNALDPIVQKLYTVPAEPLTIEERYLLREALINIGSHVNMINMDLSQAEAKKKSFVKKILRK